MNNLNLFGEIINGNQIGESIDFKTANIDYKGDEEFQNGVYGCKVLGLDKEYFGILNIGVRPTVEDNGKISYEVHIFDFNSNIYGLNVEVELLFFIREEVKFESIGDLKNKIANDIIIVKDRLEII